jgi:hypothetical protein
MVTKGSVQRQVTVRQNAKLNTPVEQKSVIKTPVRSEPQMVLPQPSGVNRFESAGSRIDQKFVAVR